MERRAFLKQGCMTCLAFAGAGALLSLEGCASLPVVKVEPSEGARKVVLPVASLGPEGMVIVRSRSFSNDILVVRNAEGTYDALLMRCTHQDQPLTATRSGLHCASHGSTFDLQGNVVAAPAERPLTRYPVTVLLDQLNISIHN
ncbi:MAG: Rieske (2Fe-2S) protein [Flavobacteriales bacterium]